VRSLNNRPGRKEGLPRWVSVLLWGIAMISVFFMGIVMVQRTPFIRGTANQAEESAKEGANLVQSVESNEALPDSLAPIVVPTAQSLKRDELINTSKPDRGNTVSQTYTIESGDSIYGIAKHFDLKPETILWSNYNVLHDDVHNISVGDELIIPPGNGIYYEWKENDELQKVANKYHVTVKSILAHPANKLDITNPVIKTGEFVLLPDAYRETAIISPVTFEYSKGSGVKKVISGPGGCAWDYAVIGSGGFIWPAPGRSVSGNDFWSGHLGLDIGAVEGAPIYASDSGTVIYSGPIGGGYGIMVMIDHGNGYQTLYAHLSSTAVGCGQGVSAGQTIGYAGSTGNSTGAHLHFEVRYGGGYVNPWNVL
jgi:murein DD-endopeptidase MepM/ murein hydrolase activator NlpD